MLYLASIWVIPIIVAITFHEAAHGFVAYLLGDDTAWRLGRVSFNPLKHVDPFGTILLPGVLLLLRSPFIFGYARPRRRGHRISGCLAAIAHSRLWHFCNIARLRMDFRFRWKSGRAADITASPKPCDRH